MALNFNKITLGGRVTRDPESTFGTTGTQIVKFGVAVNDPYKKQEQEVDFFDVVVFGKLAEIVALYVHKGDEILIHGKLKHNRWVNKEGEKRSNYNVIADTVNFTSRPKSENAEQPAPKNATTATEPAFFGTEEITNNDDVPF